MEAPDFLAAIRVMEEFLDAAKNQSQEEILKAFLQYLIHGQPLCESGSILIDYPEVKKLRLFNPGNFLTKEGYLKPDEPWQVEFEYNQGLAGAAFTKREVIFRADVPNDPDFSVVEGDVPIANMICLPIITDPGSPFGVASFHNSSPSRFLDEAARTFAKAYVSLLGLALSRASEPLERHRSGHRRLFIGCASEDLSAARVIQNHLRQSALVQIWNQGLFKAGSYVLETLLTEVKKYDCAVFLLTPTDIVVHRGGRYLVARDNVLFEAGLFFSQLGRDRTLLIIPEVQELKLPSDLDGLIKLTYQPVGDPADLAPALAPACNDIIERLARPLARNS